MTLTLKKTVLNNWAENLVWKDYFKRITYKVGNFQRELFIFLYMF